MKTYSIALALSLFALSAASAQTAPTRPAPPATMAAPNTARTEMSTAAQGTGPVSTDYSQTDKQRMRNSQPKAKTKKMKTTMSDGSGKMKTKM